MSRHFTGHRSKGSLFFSSEFIFPTNIYRLKKSKCAKSEKGNVFGVFYLTHGMKRKEKSKTRERKIENVIFLSFVNKSEKNGGWITLGQVSTPKNVLYIFTAANKTFQ
jgi:hypothetical protein